MGREQELMNTYIFSRILIMRCECKAKDDSVPYSVHSKLTSCPRDALVLPLIRLYGIIIYIYLNVMVNYERVVT